MSELLTYDPGLRKSRNGIPADELISMLQKSIRRGEVKTPSLQLISCISPALSCRISCGAGC